MERSKHALKRCQQRDIKSRQVELILQYGVMNNKRGAYECSIPKSIFRQIISDFKKRIQDLENISRSNKTILLIKVPLSPLTIKENFN